MWKVSITTRSAANPGLMRPTSSVHFIESTALMVTISTSSRSVNVPANSRWFQRSAIFNSCSAPFDPDGDQSGARLILTPAAFARSTLAVSPYSSRFEVGDQTSEAPTCAIAPNSCSLSGTPWITINSPTSRPFCSRISNSAREDESVPSERWRNQASRVPEALPDLMWFPW